MRDNLYLTGNLFSFSGFNKSIAYRNIKSITGSILTSIIWMKSIKSIIMLILEGHVKIEGFREKKFLGLIDYLSYF